MSNVFFTSDWHLDHNRVLEFAYPDGRQARPFDSIEEHNKTLLDNYCKLVKERDVVYFLGDVSFSIKGLSDIASLPGSKLLVRGNHDKFDLRHYLAAFDDIFGIVSYKEFWLSHCPIHPEEIRNRTGNIHGHTHHYVMGGVDYYNVCPEVSGFTPVSLSQIRIHYESKKPRSR